MMLNGMTVRFFAWLPDDSAELTGDGVSVQEVSEQDFLWHISKGASVEYERHTVRENGASQICLTATFV